MPSKQTKSLKPVWKDPVVVIGTAVPAIILVVFCTHLISEYHYNSRVERLGVLNAESQWLESQGSLRQALDKYDAILKLAKDLRQAEQFKNAVENAAAKQRVLRTEIRKTDEAEQIAQERVAEEKRSKADEVAASRKALTEESRLAGYRFRLKHKLKMPQHAYGFALSRSGTYLAACGIKVPPGPTENGQAVVWKLPEGSAFATYHSDACMDSLAISPDEMTLAIGFSGEGIGRSIKFYDMNTSREKQMIRDESKRPVGTHGLAFSPDGKLLATEDGLFDAERGERICDFRGTFAGLFSPDGRIALSRKGFFDIAARRFSVECVETVCTSASFLASGAVLASADFNVVLNKGLDVGVRSLRLRNTRTGLGIPEESAFGGDDRRVTAVAFSPDGSLLVTGNFDGKLMVWDYATERRIATLEGHSVWVLNVLFSLDGLVMASGTIGGDVIVWAVEYPPGEQR
jgi:hypothetical protein